MIELVAPLISTYHGILQHYELCKGKLHVVQQEIIQFRCSHLCCALNNFNLLFSIDQKLNFEGVHEFASNIYTILGLHSKSSDSFKLWQITNRRSSDYAVKGLICLKGLTNLTDDQRTLIKELEDWVLVEDQKWIYRMDASFAAKYFNRWIDV